MWPFNLSLFENTLVIFQSTHLIRGVTVDIGTINISDEFQSTHLIRGVTASWIGDSPASFKFQSTHLIRGVTNKSYFGYSFVKTFQSTHLIRGVTRWKRRKICLRKNFNPHTSYEVWQFSWLINIFNAKISIHTPHTRCDILLTVEEHTTLTFQSTHLIRGVTRSRWLLWPWRDYFNPHTSYEVWQIRGHQRHRLVYISIHTPHTRCDSKEMWSSIESLKFQSTHLIRGVTGSLFLQGVIMINISIHTPHTRCDHGNTFLSVMGIVISIHTPHTRCDSLLFAV